MQLVAGAVTCASPNYRATITLSHAAADQPVASSPRYRLVSGAVTTKQ